VEAGSVRYAGDVAVADGALEWRRRVAPLDLVDGDAVDPVVQNDGALAPRQEFELAVAIALQEVRHVGPKALSDLAGANALRAPAFHHGGVIASISTSAWTMPSTRTGSVRAMLPPRTRLSLVGLIVVSCLLLSWINRADVRSAAPSTTALPVHFLFMCCVRRDLEIAGPSSVQSTGGAGSRQRSRFWNLREGVEAR
jgi:hypothetical protein